MECRDGFGCTSSTRVTLVRLGSLSMAMVRLGFLVAFFLLAQVVSCQETCINVRLDFWQALWTGGRCFITTLGAVVSEVLLRLVQMRRRELWGILAPFNVSLSSPARRLAELPSPQQMGRNAFGRAAVCRWTKVLEWSPGDGTPTTEGGNRSGNVQPFNYFRDVRCWRLLINQSCKMAHLLCHYSFVH